MSDNPTGTVTFLFTDIEGSTERWQRDHGSMSVALAAHDQMIRLAVEKHGGIVFKHTGDGLCAVFTSATSAVAAAVEAQAGLELPVRMGLHTGEAESRDGDYFGPTLNRAARVMDAGHAGQVLVSSATAGLVRDLELINLGEHRLKGLETVERIFQVGVGNFPVLRTLRPVVGNLPVELSTFVGRMDELKSLVEELEAHRLVTLIGVGGTGKTRLSIETAGAVSESFPDGCWMVELAVVAVPEGVPFAFCSGLGITAPSDGDVIGHLVARLRDKRMLIVLDNCEHLLAASADVVEHIIASCPGVVVLATSREPLMIRGEHLVPVPSLLPEEAERLFLERARDEAPDLVIDDEQARAVAKLCERLDGLPLALELAASRVRAFTPIELVANLDERFRMLVGGRRSRMERHQTMRGTLDWSYELCSVLEQTVFDRLSVFPAGFDMSAARAVAGADGVSEFDVVDVVPQLVDRSLLQRSIASDGTTRYRMLETMRAYGREHLQHQGTSDTIRARHANYMAATISELGLQHLGPDEQQVLQRLSECLPDALVALDWSIDHHEWEDGLRVIPALGTTFEREVIAMLARLHDAARAGGAPVDLLDELECHDIPLRLDETTQQATERGWRRIRARQPIPSDRFALPPHGEFSDGGIAATDVDEFLDSVDHWLAAPSVTRFVAEWCAMRALIHNDHLERADERWSRITTLATELQSARATRLVDELHGTMARARRDWAEAAHWYSKVVEVVNGKLRNWLDLSATWHLLAARCLGPGDVEISGDDLREPWRCYHQEHLDVLRWHGAVSTALALQRLGHTGLADRFVAWAYRNDPIEIMASANFGGLLEIAGLPTAQVDVASDLDTLLGELFEIADGLDRPTA